MGQVVELHKQQEDERDVFDALREKWKHERLPDGETEEGGAMFLGVLALIVMAGVGAFLIGYFWP